MCKYYRFQTKIQQEDEVTTIYLLFISAGRPYVLWILTEDSLIDRLSQKKMYDTMKNIIKVELLICKSGFCNFTFFFKSATCTIYETT